SDCSSCSFTYLARGSGRLGDRGMRAFSSPCDLVAVAIAVRRRAGAATTLGVVLLDLGARGRERVPLRTKGVDLLAVRLSLRRVLDEPVERVVVVGDLEASVGSLRGSEERRLSSCGCERLSRRDPRGP